MNRWLTRRVISSEVVRIEVWADEPHRGEGGMWKSSRGPVLNLSPKDAATLFAKSPEEPKHIVKVKIRSELYS
jgi:hypothetical protein